MFFLRFGLFFVNHRSLSPKPLINHRCQWWATNHSFNGNGSIVKNHWKNHWYKWLRSEKPLKNHWHQWFTWKKKLKNHLHQWFTCKKNHWKTINYNGIFGKNHYHSIVVKILPSFMSIVCKLTKYVKNACFLANFIQLTKILHNRRSWRSWQKSTLFIAKVSPKTQRVQKTRMTQALPPPSSSARVSPIGKKVIWSQARRPLEIGSSTYSSLPQGNAIHPLLLFIHAKYETVADAPKSWVWWRADFQSGSKVLKKVSWNSLCKSGSKPKK